MVGGGIAVYAVTRTLRHERHMSDLAAARESSLRLYAGTWDLLGLEAERADDPASQRLHIYARAMFETVSLTASRWPGYSGRLSVGLGKVTTAIEDPGAKETVDSLTMGIMATITQWVRNPESFEPPKARVWLHRWVPFAPPPPDPDVGAEVKRTWPGR